MLTEFTKQKKLFVFSTPLFFITILILLSSIINAQNQRAIDGEKATCKITFNGKVFEPKLNQIGYFDRVLHIPALTKISVEVYYPDGNINDKIVLFVEDGGKLDSDKATETVQLNNQKRLSFNFETVAQPGLFRVVLKKGNDTKVVQFWSDKKNTSINAPTYDDDEYCGNDKQEGTDGGDDDEDDDDCIPCKQKDSSNTPEPGDAFVPFTGNESRNVQDLEIWGGPGEIPLKWTRYGNSRGGDFKHRIGTAYFWNYSFNYTMLDEGPNDQGHDQVSIHYPQGGKNTFTQDTINPNVWLPEAGIDKILFQDANNFFLQFANGHRYRFEKLTDTSRGIYYQLQDFRDIFQNLYTLTYENRLLKKVTEPAGRYFEIYYDSVIGVPMISKVSTNDGRSVLYNYDIYNDTISAENVIKWIRLINVSYGDGTQAVYTYSQREHGSMPVLEHAIDPRYTGMDVNMIYIYDTSMNIAGFIKEERNGATGEIMTTLTPGVPDKIVCYANGRVQTFKEPTGQQGYLNTYNDGLGRSTKYVYDDAGIGFLKSKTDALGRTTIYNKKTIYGNPLKITYPDGSIEKWTRDSLDLVLTHTDELGRATTYTRDNNHRVKRIDYPDNSYEIFTYNNFGEVLEHKRRNGGIERTVYDSRGLRRTFRDAE
jgi:YD repeat-containing protein